MYFQHRKNNFNFFSKLKAKTVSIYNKLLKIKSVLLSKRLNLDLLNNLTDLNVTKVLINFFDLIIEFSNN